MSLYEGEPTIWMRSIRYHTYNGAPQPEDSYYLAHEYMVETIESVLKFAVRDTAPPKAERTPEPAPVVSASASAAPLTTAKWPTPSSTTTAKRRRT